MKETKHEIQSLKSVICTKNKRKVNEYITDYDTNEYKAKKKKSKSNITTDMTLENTNCIETKKSKKKKKYDDHLTIVEADIKDNIGENIIDDTKYIPDMSLENSNYIKTKKSKKKKKYDDHLTIVEADIKDNIGENIIGDTKYIPDMSLENSNYIKTKKSKKKKKHNDYSSLLETNIKDTMSENIIDNTKNISDMSLEDSNCIETKKSKKTKEFDDHLNCLVTTTNDTIAENIIENTKEISIDNNFSINNSFESKKKCDEHSNFLEVTTHETVTENCEDINNMSDIYMKNKGTNICVKKEDNITKQHENINPLEIVVNNNEKQETCLRRTRKLSIDNISNKCVIDKKKIRKNKINYPLNKESDNNSNIVINMKANEKDTRKISDIQPNIKNIILNDYRNSLSITQENNEFEDLLNIIDVDEFTTETKVNLQDFDLISYLTNSEYLLDNPQYSLILTILSKQIKNLINNKCNLISQSDIQLLKTIGEIILKQIIEKQSFCEKIQHLNILLPQESTNNKIHYVETTLSRQPNKEKMNVIKKMNPFLKLGVFNEEEDNIIRRYWFKFQQEYKITNIEPFLSNGLEMCLPYNERLKFFRYISAGLPNRLLYSVYNRFNTLFNKQVDKNSFSKKEDELIMKIDNCDVIKNKFSILSMILNRTRLQLYRRLHTLKMEPLRKEHIFWDISKRQELFTSILLETNTEDWRDLKNIAIKKKTWIKIAKRCNESLSYEKYRSQWNYLSTMLFCETPIQITKLKFDILNLLMKRKPKYWSDINWVDITNNLYPGASSKVIVTMFHWWITDKVPTEIKKNVQDTLKYLSTHELDNLIKQMKYKEKVFPRLKVKNYDVLVEIN